MGKITRTMQHKHRAALTPWLKNFVQEAVDTPLPLLPKKLNTFPTAWPFPRGDLYHWIPLLNRFDNILATFTQVYKLNDGPQTEEFASTLLSNQPKDLEYADSVSWDSERLAAEGYLPDGDRQLIEAVLRFTTMLLDRCGNRSIYASSTHLNELLHTTSMTILQETLQVGSKLAHRYQASVKRLGGSNNSRQISALLANHYNIDLNRVQLLTQAFTKTPLTLTENPVTPSAKGKEKAQAQVHGNNSRAHGSKYANDLASIIDSDSKAWAGWGDIRIQYYPQSSVAATTEKVITPPQPEHETFSTMPHTPTPLQRTSTMGSSTSTSRQSRLNAEETSQVTTQGIGFSHDEASTNLTSGQKTFQLSEATIECKSIHEIMAKAPGDMPEFSRYELFHRLRVAKALLGDNKSRQGILAIRMLAILNLAFIHPEQTFVDKVLRYDIDEIPKYQLVYQLAELIHPTINTGLQVPLWIQTIALALLENISMFETRFSTVFSALNANVNHGVLLYVFRKAVAGIKQDKSPATKTMESKWSEQDDWRRALLSLSLEMSMNTRVGREMAAAGLVECLIEALSFASPAAKRLHATFIQLLDCLVLSYQSAFDSFFAMNGLDAISKLVVDAAAEALTSIATNGTNADMKSEIVDYNIPYWQQSNLRWALKFIHHAMSNWYNNSGNADRLLRNLAEKSELLHTLRTIMENVASFGSAVWTHSVTILSDFINNDPTSFVAISESGMIRSFLESVSSNSVPEIQQATEEEREYGEGPDQQLDIEPDTRQHPPPPEVLSMPRSHQLAKGIFPAAGAIRSIPNAINSISLNRSGLRMVAASRVIEAFMEVFESSPHLNCMANDRNLSMDLGRSFDELSRHHPRLKQHITNAVIDMVARVREMGYSSQSIEDWGTHIYVLDSNGNRVHCDKDLPKNLRNADAHPGKIVPDNPEGKKSFEFTTCVQEVSTFLEVFLSNDQLGKDFGQAGGMGILLDIIEAPSLNSAALNPDSPLNTMFSVIARIAEQTSTIYMPQLCTRTLSAMALTNELIRPGDNGGKFFTNFINENLMLTADNFEKLSDESKRILTHGEEATRALMKTQMLLLTLCYTFPVVSRGQVSSRSHNVNIYDYHYKLIQECGRLIWMCLKESCALNHCVPMKWQPLFLSNIDIKTVLSTAATGESHVLIHTLAETPEYNVVDVLGSPDHDTTDLATLTTDEVTELKKDTRYLNYQVLKFLLDTAPAALPSLFAAYGRTLFSSNNVSRREYVKGQHLEIAAALGDVLINPLKDLSSSTEESSLVPLIRMLQVFEDSTYDGLPDMGHARVILPIFFALQKNNIFALLNKLIGRFSREIQASEDPKLGKNPGKISVYGLRKILEFYSLLVTMKTSDATNVNFLLRKFKIPEPVVMQVLTTEIRAAIGPTILELWKSDAMGRLPRSLVAHIISILRIVSSKEEDFPPSSKLTKPIFELFFGWTFEPFRFDSSVIFQTIQSLSTLGSPETHETLSIEAAFRCDNTLPQCIEYCRAHIAGRAGPRNLLPEGITCEYVHSAQGGEPMSVETDSHANIDYGDDEDEHSDSSSDTTDDQDDRSQNSDANMESISENQNNENSSSSIIPAVENRKLIFDLRSEMMDSMIDRSLEVLSTQPDSALEISELILSTLDQESEDDAEKTAGSIIIYALSSLSDKGATDGPTISAYAHLLALLLQNPSFFNSNFTTLKETLESYLEFLEPIEGMTCDELSSWVPYILLILEIFLSHDEQPQESRWPTGSEDNTLSENSVLIASKSMFTSDHRSRLLTRILDMLPLIGKQETLATAVLRILLILTRDRKFATIVGERKNLQRLFVMVKQLLSNGADRFRRSKINKWVMIILRHIIEDDETVKQIMRCEIKNYFENPSRNPRSLDIPTYLKALSSLALRSPALFVEVSNEMLRFVHWSSSIAENGRGLTIGLKNTAKNEAPASLASQGIPGAGSEVKGDAEAHTQAENVKVSTEGGDDIDMTDTHGQKSQDKKIPVLENPDGVIHFLLCELVNYREVEDKEVLPPSEEKPRVESATSVQEQSSQSTSSVSGASPLLFNTPDEKKDSAASSLSGKSSFKVEEHPIFVYRCFILTALTELLQSYNRTKMEFINFRRSAPVQNNTPVRPRSSVLNYLITDLLCQGNSNGTAETIAAKKKLVTASHVQRLLVALTYQANEKKYLVAQNSKFEYDDDEDLLFVRTFVLDTILKAYERVTVPEELPETRYLRMKSLSELMYQMIGDKEQESSLHVDVPTELKLNYMQIRRMMFEKGYIERLTASIADIDLNYPGVKRSLKYILRVLRVLTDTAKELSLSNLIATGSLPDYEDDLQSTSSLSDVENNREETLDLYRNTALGISEIRDDDDEYHDEHDVEDEEMYDDEYDEEMEYDEEEMSEGDEDTLSDDDEEAHQEMEGMDDMGSIEGLPGQPVLTVVDEDDDMDDSNMDDDEFDSEDIPELDIHQEILNEDGNIIDDDGDSAWESEDQHHDDDDMGEHHFEAEVEEADDHEHDHDPNHVHHHADQGHSHHHHHHHHHGRRPIMVPDADIFDNLARAVMGQDGEDYGDHMDEMDEHYGDMEGDEEDDIDDDDEYVFEENFSYDVPAPAGSLMGWDSVVPESGHSTSRPRLRVNNRVPSSAPRWSGRGEMPDPRHFVHHTNRSHMARVISVEEGMNPLLRPRHAVHSSIGRNGGMDDNLLSFALPSVMLDMGTRAPSQLNGTGSLTVLQELISTMPEMHRNQPWHVQIGQSAMQALYAAQASLPHGTEWRREGSSSALDPTTSVIFDINRSRERYQEETSLIFSPQVHDCALKLAPAINAALTPAAIEEVKRMREEQAAKQAAKQAAFEDAIRKEREQRQLREAEERAERARKEEEERIERERKEEEERVERERKEREEQERIEREGGEASTSATGNGNGNDDQVQLEGSSQVMEGIEAQQATPNVSQGTSSTQPRVLTMIRGEEVDVTELGIDPDYLAALPEEFRAEVIAQTVSTRRSEARQQSQGTQNEEFQEFLDALPDELRDEIIHHERQEQRRRNRDEQRRTSHPAPGPAGSNISSLSEGLLAVHVDEDEMDAASILLTFPPELREQVLLDQPQEIINQLPPSLMTQARDIFQAQIQAQASVVRQNIGGSISVTGQNAPDAGSAVSNSRQASGSIPGLFGLFPSRNSSGFPNVPNDEASQRPARRTGVVQMLDKAGVATLLRLMFIAQQGSIRTLLFNVLCDVCENRHNRIEIISTILHILQDGSTDMDAVERSFSQLSLKAKRPRDLPMPIDPLKTPQSVAKRTDTLSTALVATSSGLTPATTVSTHSDISPLLIVQHCLDLLTTLSNSNVHIAHFFLTEHDVALPMLKRAGSALGPSSARSRSKTRASKDQKAQRFAINSLLSLLDRDLVMESSVVMTLLAELINRLTAPLLSMDRRLREAQVQQRKEAEGKQKQVIGADAGASSAADAARSSSSAIAAAPEASDTNVAGNNETHESLPRTIKPIQMPVISNYNLTLVVKIFVARECSSRTFQNTIYAIKNLLVIPGAKSVFGQELVRQAHILANNISGDLDDLLPCIQQASSGTEIQGIALAKFSPGTSEQNKLLRVLTALDHLFDVRKKLSSETRTDDGSASSKDDDTDKNDLVLSLYHDSGLSTMWDKLSACLQVIRERENMINVATILLPLIESLMVVCKNTTYVTDHDSTTAAASGTTPKGEILASSRDTAGKEVVASSPEATSSESGSAAVPTSDLTPQQRLSSLFFTFTGEHRRILNELVRNNPKLMSANFSLLVKNPTVLEFDNKRNYFTRSVHFRNQQQSSMSYQPLQLSVRRDMVFHDSYRSLYFKTGNEMKYGKLNIRFHGEEGVDAGGVTREWFQVLSRQMFDANYALFTPVSSDRTTFHPNKLSAVNDQHLTYFKFVGRIIGKALYEGRLLDCHFSRAVYKRILGKSVSVKDMESFDPDYYKSLLWMLDNDITDIIVETFSVEDEEFGATTIVDLIPDGRNIAVTEENKKEYVRLVVEHKLLSSVKEQMENFLKGFHDIIPAELISIFNEQELELLISGLPDVDIDDWKTHTEYHNYTAASPQIQWFWRALRSFDKEERAKMLQFVTGTSKVPLNGFKELEGMNGVSRFNIHRDYGNKDRLPSSHTCFNQLDLPEYESYEVLRKQLIKAITAGNDYFGFA